MLLSSVFGQDCATPVEIHGSLSVSGNQILNSHSDPFALAGNCFFWSNDDWGGEDFYTSEVVDYLVDDWKSSIIRISMGVDEYGGYLTSPASNLAKVKTLIDASIKRGRYVIVDWHSHHAEDYPSEAVAFFTEIAQTYGHHPNLIYEIYNEPLIVSWSSVIKPYSETVIDAIREEDPDNLIIVGSSTWSQDVDVVSRDPIVGETNIAYTIHFYAGTHGDHLRQKCQTALDNGIALFCTEWGSVSATGDGDVAEANTREWIDFFKTNHISHCNWAVNNKAEGASIFKPSVASSGGWSDADLTASGLLTKELILDWAPDCETVTTPVVTVEETTPVVTVDPVLTVEETTPVVTDADWVNHATSLEGEGNATTYSFTDWASTYGVTGEKTSDSDGDGVSNVAEFLLGSNPSEISSIPTFSSAVVQENGENYFRMTFTIDPAAQGVEYRLQVAPNLIEWSAPDGVGGMELESVTEQDDGMLQVQWKSASSFSEESMNPRYFVRIVVR